MSPTQFLAVFFGRASHVVRKRYGQSAYIDASGPNAIAIKDSTGLLGCGDTLGDAMAAADKTVVNRNQAA